MRQTLARSFIALLAVLLATGLLAPLARTQAAAPAVGAFQPSITGTVVATPQLNLPATMLIQMGGQTIAVAISSSTQLERRFGGTSSLSEFTDGDTVIVVGLPDQSGTIMASLIINQSVQAAFTDLQGTVSSINPPGTVPTTIVLTNLQALGGANAPFPNPLPSQMNLPVSSSTTITIGGNTQPAGNLIGQVNVNDTVIATGVFDSFSNQFDSIINIKEAAVPPVTRQVTGTLAAAPSQLTAPVTLCLQGAMVTSQALTLPALTSLCPTGAQLAVYVTAGTTLVRLFNGPSALFELSQGDTLQVTGVLAPTVIGGQTFTVLIASQIQDKSIDLPTIQGTVQSIAAIANGKVTNVVISVTSGTSANAAIPSGKLVTLPLANSTSPNCTAPSNTQFPCTMVTTSSGTTKGYNPGELAVGQAVTATGVFNSQLMQFLYISQITGPAAAPPVTLHVKGTLFATPSQLTAPVTLCLQGQFLTPQAITPQVAPLCAQGQLAVYVNDSTQLLRGSGDAALLAELSKGDVLQVTGALAPTQIGGQTFTVLVASQIQDDSITLAAAGGTVQTITPNGNLTNVAITVSRFSGSGAAIASGTQVTLPLFNSSSPNCTAPSSSQLPCTKVTAAGGTTNGYNTGELATGNSVTALGVFNTLLNQFIEISTIAATSTTSAAPPPPAPGGFSVHFSGILAANPSATTAPVTLCLRAPHGLSKKLLRHLTAGVCAGKQIPVVVTASTRIVRRNNAASSLNQLDRGDRLVVAGMLAGGQITAVWIKDNSLERARDD